VGKLRGSRGAKEDRSLKKGNTGKGKNRTGMNRIIAWPTKGAVEIGKVKDGLAGDKKKMGGGYGLKKKI